MRRSGVTLQDIAERTGVSKVTVSYILNNRETRVRISEATRRRVLDAVREMGYHPNAVARALKRRRTDTLTLVLQSPSFFSGGSGFLSEMMYGVLASANRLGYDLMLHTKELPSAAAEMRALTDGRSDGVLILRDMDDPLPPALHERGLPCVCLFSRSVDPNVAFVDCDNVAGGCLAAEHLLSRGHRRIGFVGGAPSSAAVRDRLAGFAAALAAAGAPLRPEDTVTHISVRGDFSPLLEILRRPDRPTALFVWSDDVAAWAIAVLHEELGLRVPDDLSVLGFDGVESICGSAMPRLTSISQPIHAIARHAVELLAALIDETPTETTQLRLAPELLPGASCAAPPGAAPSDPPYSQEGQSK